MPSPVAPLRASACRDCVLSASVLNSTRMQPRVLEGVLPLQVFRLRVDGGALPGRGDPGPADLHAPVVTVNVEITRRPDGLGDGVRHRDEADHQTGRLFRQCRHNVGPYLVR
jgi:hypothetical protein